MPKAYYEEVGPDKFIEAPIGAGAYKITGQTTGQSVTMEAYEDYWRKVPNIKTIETKGIPELASRVAALKTGGSGRGLLRNRRAAAGCHRRPGHPGGPQQLRALLVVLPRI